MSEHTLNPPNEIPLTECDREQIHRIGSIQAHGVLIAAEVESLHVSHVSANAESWLHRPVSAILGSSLMDLLPEQAQHYLKN